MTEGFDEFLSHCLSEEPPAFIRGDESVKASDIEAAERELGVELSSSYKHFLLRCGVGRWCGEQVVHPSELYAFDNDCLEMEGFIPLVHNVNGRGDYLAINPSEPAAEGERPIHYCRHDPFGSVRIAESFEDWARRIKAARKSGVNLYAGAS